jgi:hypothetical protein
MKLHGIIDIKVEGERIMRDPVFWDKIKKAFGATPDLRTDRMRATLEAATIVEASRKALARLNTTNAIALIIDNQVLYEDREGRQDDLIDLMHAFHENKAVFGTSFKLLRLVVEHEEAGLHFVIEVMARSEHHVDETAARVVIGARISDFEPRDGESAEAFRARVEPLLKTPAVAEAHRVQFESFVSRLADALRGSLADAQITVREAEAQVEKPSRTAARPAHAPTDLRYDPYVNYYPNRLGDLLPMMMWSSMLSWSMMPHYAVVDTLGNDIASTDDLSQNDMESVANGEDTDFGGDDFGDGGDSDGGGDFGDGGSDDFGGGFDFGDW